MAQLPAVAKFDFVTLCVVPRMIAEVLRSKASHILTCALIGRGVHFLAPDQRPVQYGVK
jgi:hypothetical protein